MLKTRMRYLAATVAVILLGLASRRYSQYLPQFISDYAGDVLWAAAAYLGLRAIFPKWRAWNAAVVALVFSFSIEISQLYQAPWINEIRRTLFGRLILGQGFLWTDLACYCLGVGAGAVLDIYLFRPHRGEPDEV